MSQGLILENEWLTSDWLAEYAEFEEGTLTLVIPEDAGFRGIADRAFQGFTGEEVILPKGLIYIGKEAFKGLKNLRYVMLPAELEYIDEEAFYGCESLEEIELPKGLTTIRREAFYDCHSLKEVKIPKTVQEIESFAFYRCESLTKLKIKRGVRLIGTRAFGGCVNLVNFHRWNMPGTVNLHQIVVNGLPIREVWYEIFEGSPCARGVLERQRIAKRARAFQRYEARIREVIGPPDPDSD